jgi:hypothetical protein
MFVKTFDLKIYSAKIKSISLDVEIHSQIDLLLRIASLTICQL